MLTQDPSTVTMTQDPLAIQFMTQGQMGYMPQAQFLTPAEYGAFRTIPGGRASNFMNQDPGALQSWLIRNRGGVLGLPAYTFNTYNPAVNLQDYMHKIITQGYDESMAATGVLADGLFSMGLGSVAGMAFGGPIGIAAGLLAPSISSPMIDRIRDMRAIQNMTKSKIIGGPDVNMATGMGFNASSARSMDSFLRFQGADDALLKEGDWRKLLQLGIESGQFDFAGSSMQYKEALKKIRKSLTTMMEVAGTTDFRELMGEFKRMQTMGAEMGQYNNIARKENLYSRITGMSHSDMINTFGQQGALIYQQAGQTGYQGSLQAMANAATVTIGQRMGLIGEGTLSRYGGVSGLTQSMTQQDAQAQNVLEKYLLPYFSNGNFTGLDNSKSLMDLLNSKDPLGMMMGSIGEKITSPEQMMAYDRNKKNLMTQLQDKFGQDNLQATVALSVGKQAGLKGMEALEYGYRTAYGFDPAIAHIKAQTITSQDFREQEERERQLARRKQREEEDLQNNPFRKLARAIDRGFTTFGENIFGGIVRKYGDTVARKIEEEAGINTKLGPELSNPHLQAAVDESKNWEHQGPKEHWISNAAELGEYARKYKPDEVTMNEKDGMRLGRYGIQTGSEIAKQYVPWLKKQGEYGQKVAAALQKAGISKSFDKLSDAEKSALSDVMKEFGGGEEYQRLEDSFMKDVVFEGAKNSVMMNNPEAYKHLSMNPHLQKMLLSGVLQYGVDEIKQGKVGGEIQDMKDLTRLSEKFESDYNPQNISLDVGGLSYGRYQISSTGGSAYGFEDWLINRAGPEGKKYGEAFRALGGLKQMNGNTHSAVANKYREFAKDSTFLKLEDEYIKLQYNTNLKKIKESSPEAYARVMTSPTLQRVLFSESVQLGNLVWTDERFKKAHEASKTDADFIKHLYNTRSNRKYFKRHIQQDGEAKFQKTIARFPKEMKVALGMLAKEKGYVSKSAGVDLFGKSFNTPELSDSNYDPYFNKRSEDAQSNYKPSLEEEKKKAAADRKTDKATQEAEKAEQAQAEQNREIYEEARKQFDKALSYALSKTETYGDSWSGLLKLGKEEYFDPGDVDTLENFVNLYRNMHGMTDNELPAELVPEFPELAQRFNDYFGKKLNRTVNITGAQIRDAVDGDNKITEEIATQGGTEAYVRKVLESKAFSDLKLTKNEIAQLAQDPLAKQIILSAGMDLSLQHDRKEGIKIWNQTNSNLNKFQEKKREILLYNMADVQQKVKDEIYDVYLPKLDNFDEKDKLYNVAFSHDKQSNPAVLGITRLNALLEVREKYKDDDSSNGKRTKTLLDGQINELIKRSGLSAYTVEELLKRGNRVDYDITRKSSNKSVRELTADQAALANRAGASMGYAMRDMSYTDLQSNTDAFTKAMSGSTGLLTTNQLAYFASAYEYDAQKFVSRINNATGQKFNLPDLYTPQGIQRAIDAFQKKFGDNYRHNDLELLKLNLKKAQNPNGPQLNASDYGPLGETKSRKSTSTTNQAGFDPGTRNSAQLNYELNQNGVDPAKQNAAGTGNPLTNETVASLVGVMNRVNSTLESLDTTIRTKWGK